MPIEITDATFRYGLGAFETVLVKSGVPQFIEWHWENLCEAASVLGIALPERNVLEKSFSGDGIWRWFATSGGTQDFFECGIPPVPEQMRVVVSDLRVSSMSWEARYKTNSYLLHYQAKKEANADEALLFNENGFLACASMANVFFVKDGVLCTPICEAGCRRGVVRRWVIEKSGIKVVEGFWSESDVSSAEELFLTNSRIGICPIARLGEVHKGVGSVTSKLRGLYDRIGSGFA